MSAQYLCFFFFFSYIEKTTENVRQKLNGGKKMRRNIFTAFDFFGSIQREIFSEIKNKTKKKPNEQTKMREN